MGLPWWLREESASNVGDLGWIPRLERPLGEWHGNPLHYSCLENSIEQPGLQSMGWQRAGHDWAANTHTHHLLSAYSEPGIILRALWLLGTRTLVFITTLWRNHYFLFLEIKTTTTTKNLIHAQGCYLKYRLSLS